MSGSPRSMSPDLPPPGALRSSGSRGGRGTWCPRASPFVLAVQRTVLEDEEPLLARLRDIRQVIGCECSFLRSHQSLAVAAAS